MVDIAVKSGAAWVCRAQDHHLVDVLRPVHINSKDDEEVELSEVEGDEANAGSPVLLEQTEEGSPCVLTVRCSPDSTTISRLLVISEARTIEVYDQMGEYCGTVRGTKDDSIQPDSEDRGPFYRKQLIMEHPSSTCDVKLLSLAGRSSVLVCRVVVGLQQQQQPCPVRGPGIDMQQVQCLVEEMGTSLSPGAQNLMEMVQFQQKNQTSSLGGFLPLLMGSGAFSALAREGNISSAVFRNQVQSADSRPLVESLKPAGEIPPSQNGSTLADSSSSSTDLPQSDINSKNMSSESRGLESHSHLTEMMSHFLKGQGLGATLNSSPELLPMLQSVCGQVTQLRLDDAAVAAEKEKLMRNGTWELDSAMERRLEEMERRLKEHVDRRLDALEQKLEKALLSALPLALNHGAVSSSALGAASTGPSEQTAQTPAMH